jgi:Immunoglobulin I-set domain
LVFALVKLFLFLSIGKISTIGLISSPIVAFVVSLGWKSAAFKFHESNIFLNCARWYKFIDGSLRKSPVPLGDRIKQVSGTLIIKNAVVEDSGKYLCVVNNSVGGESVETVRQNLALQRNLNIIIFL